MSGSKFMVFKLKEVLKTAVFAILGVLIILAVIYFLVPKSDDTALYEPGVYTAPIVLDNEKLNLEVTVDETKIKSISLVHTAETLPVFYPLFEQTAQSVGDKIVEKQSLDIDLPQDASVTASLIIEACNTCLEQAAIK